MPSSIFYLAIGLSASFIVLGWQGYKDSPWENFVLKKFLRTLVVGPMVGVLFFVFSIRWQITASNLGILLLTILIIERLIGETYKGFIRRASHPEYERLLIKLKITISNPYLKSVFGIASAILLSVVVIGGSIIIIQIIQKFYSTVTIGIIVGLMGGTVSAIGGALKDSQFEGFKVKKFIRSPIVGIIGGVILIHFSSQPLFLFLSVIGFERVVVEFYKTFIKRQIRGIFEGQEPTFKIWLRRRWIFAVLYGIGVAVLISLLIFGNL